MKKTGGTLVCNTRILGTHLTGVQRYLSELLTNFEGEFIQTSPKRPLNGLMGHAWEQLALPVKSGKSLLWSPSNSGPLSVERQVLTLHDMVPIDHPEWLNPLFAKWYQILTPPLLKKVRSIITISEFTKSRILFHYPSLESKIHVVHNGVDPRFSPSSNLSIRNMRQILGIPSPHYFVALGSLEPRKNLSRLLQAWTIIEKRLPDDVWLVIAGAQGRKMVFGEVSFEELPQRVYLTGHVPDQLLPYLYSGAIAAPYISLYEGFGLPPLEAMACGTPTIVGGNTALPEVVGQSSLIIDPFDPEAIADALLRLVDNSTLRYALKTQGLERAKLFSWKRCAQLTWKVFQAAGL